MSWKKLCVLFFVLVGLVVLALPQIGGYVARVLLPDHISISNIEIGWLSGIKIEGLTISDPQKRQVFSCDKIVSNRTLFSFFLSHSNLGLWQLDKPCLTLVDEKSSNTMNYPVCALQLDINDAKIVIQDQTIDLPKVKVDVSPQKDHSVQLTIDPGKIQVDNMGILSTIISILKLKASQDGKVHMWCTPVYLSLTDGLITCKRADILVANRFPIALWGTIDLGHDKVQMTLGLTHQTLFRAFAIFTLSPGFVLSIPIEGTADSPQVNTKIATSKIAALRLQQTPFLTTMIAGKVWEMANSLFSKEPPVPDPTTSPLPWVK